MKLRLRMLPSCLLSCLLSACAPSLEDPDAPFAQQAFAGDEDDPDSHSQGTQLHATLIRSVQYSSALVLHEGVHRESNLRLVRGELVADMPLLVDGTTQSLQSCGITAPTGETRSCGFVVDGQGVCTPGSVVTLAGGNSNSTRNQCVGAPVLRVCSGEAPCEHLGPGYLGSADSNVALNTCPVVEFTCPASGVYTALAGPGVPGTTWVMELSTRSQGYPAGRKVFRGQALIGARFRQQTSTAAGPWLEVTDVINANALPSTEGSGMWDASGGTFLYQVRYTPSASTSPTDLCATGVNWAVPVKGLFDGQGNRHESTTAFTLGCDSGVIAKCYRWGYRPWLDGAHAGDVTEAHWACTRMARADYCGQGTSFTQDGTRIRPWDALAPEIISPPEPGSGPDGLSFEAGWNTQGPACLSHLRWQHLTASCVPLNPPIYDANGNIVNDCRDPNTPYGPGKCAEICDNAKEAAQLYGSRVFNNSAINVP
ncbi:ADYC domain-containing protein [Myxococcus sp. Y35]|uniref:ADYC domain-containing protein n=1 Tax=Pseudomyxococcus flavus TaxID=3115648 RepID=UPI003CFBAED0